MRRQAPLIGIALALVGLATGCGAKQSPYAANRNTSQIPATKTVALKTGAPALNLPADAAKHPYTPNERVWLGQVHQWLITTGGAEGRIQFVRGDSTTLTAADAKKLQPAIRTLESCAARWQKQVGDPPTKRTKVGAGYLVAACRHMKLAGAQLAKAIRTKDPAPYVVADSELERTDDVLGAGIQALLPRSEGRDLPRIAQASDRSRVQPFYSSVAMKVVETGVEVRCWSKADWKRAIRESNAFTVDTMGPEMAAGYMLSGDRANLAPEVCAALDALVYDHVRPASGEKQLRLADAVVTLVHESTHVAGVFDEAETECYAMQGLRQAAVLLGTSKAYADGLASAFWQTIYPQEPKGYGTPACRNGGPLDLRPDDPVWP